MTAEGPGADADLARVQVELAAQAAVATPLSELGAGGRDVSRIQPVLQQLLRAVRDLLVTDMAAVYVTSSSADELYAVAWSGLPDDYMTGLRVTVGRGSAGRAVADRRPVLFADTLHDERYVEYREAARALGVRSVLSVPMLTLTGEALGALTAYRSEPGEVSDREVRLAEALARQAAEMVERARMHAEARSLAALEQRRGAQLRQLADAALALTSADTLDDLLRVTTEAAVQVVGCHQGVATRLPHGWADATTYVSLSEKYAGFRDYAVVPKGLGVLNAVTRENRPLRLTSEQLARHPEYRGLRDAPDHPPLPDYLAAPFIGRDGRNLGLLQLSDKTDGTPFTEADEAIVVQLSQMVSSAIERLEALEGERAARREAEEAARVRGLLSDASASFGASLEPRDLAQRLVEAAVPWLGDRAVVHQPDDRGGLELLALAATDPAVDADTRAFLESSPLDPDAEHGAFAVLRSQRPQLMPEISDELVADMTATPQDAERMRRLVPRSGLVVPLVVRGRAVGALSLGREEPYTEVEQQHAVELAQRAAVALDNAMQYAFERDLAAVLQRSLLPREMPTSALLTAAARYLPGARGTQIGGDWYDLLEVEGGLVLVVGDVMGRGVHAASVMGQLRSSVRAFALEGHGPADVLALLQRVADQMEDLNFTTCLVGRLDPESRALCLASAGHPSPLVVQPDGTAHYLDLDPGLPLGVGGAQYVQTEVQMAAGSALLLYTDGLVEQPGRSLDDGMARLRDGVAAPVRSAEELCDRALHVMGRDEGADDDTAVLALVLDAARDEAPALDLDLPAMPSSAATARAELVGLLHRTGHADLADTAALLVTELVANTVRHAGGMVRVRAGVRAGLLLVEVADESERLPEPRTARWEAENGRGLLLVEELADRWGAERLPTGKRVWFELGA